MRHKPDSLTRRDGTILAVGATLCFIVASVLMTGWPGGLTPNLAYPYAYSGDAYFQYWMTQRAMEGWVYNNPRSGFPFGSPSFDYPGSDSGNLLIAKVLGKIFGSYIATANVYFLLGFSAAFVATYWVLRRFEVRRDVTVIAAALFAFLPYHFDRMLLGHTFYTWYFVVPIYVYCGFKVMGLVGDDPRGAVTLSAVTTLLVASCFGVYFAFFGVLVILTCGAAAAMSQGKLRPLWLAAACTIAIVTGVAGNVGPSLAYVAKHGKNSEVAARNPIETETYALKLTHMLMPHRLHRVEALRTASNNYGKWYPLLNNDASVGVAGLLGLLLLAAAFMRTTTGANVCPKTNALVLLTGTTILFSMVGGLNVIFAVLVTPMIRGWERFTIFIAFFALAALALAADRLLNRHPHKRWLPVAAVVFAILAFWEQTGPAGDYRHLAHWDSFSQDRPFVQEIEASLPPGSAIYQVPYIDFPEAQPMRELGPYDPLTAFFHSKTLRWSSGGMKGREAANFYKSLDKKPLQEQIDTARKLGFAGIYVDRRGYADNGVGVVDEFTHLLGAGPAIYRKDGVIVFFRL